jgi:hypothetical protein
MRRSGVILGLALVLVGCGGADADEQTIALAKQAYEQAKAEGVDMANGPCLGVIKPGWVADVAHDPREDVDDEPENQCPEYRSGEADHFVELDPDGNFIRSG